MSGPLRMARTPFDLVVIGSGPAGQQAAIHAAEAGKRVAMVERKPRLGGVGLQTGTIPSKALRETAYAAAVATRSGMRASLGRDLVSQHRLLIDAIHKKDDVINQQESVLLNRLMRSGVTLIPGEARFADPHTLIVRSPRDEERQLTADAIILATGSRPRRPEWVPLDRERVHDSTSILHMTRLPERLLVVGGGVIACEFASIYAALGVSVTIIDSHAQILSWLSSDIVRALTDSMIAMGITFSMQQSVTAIRRQDGEVTATLDDGSELRGDCLLYAMGRKPNMDHLALDRAGVAIDAHGWIAVDGGFRSNVPHIYAVGDLIGNPALASAAQEQGRIAAAHACGEMAEESRHAPPALPFAIYTIPEVSSIGRTEHELQEDHVDYVVGYGRFNDSARGKIIGDYNGMVKLNVDVATRCLLGVHIVGESASELIHIGQLVISYHGVVDDLVRNVFNYPTLAECYRMAALDCLQQLTQLTSDFSDNKAKNPK
ncbi:MAG: Si-specific NAD(P)(+) transhydrogenase [Mariprofundales bacterium]|nr:Si-specific NAD(P)(+) transhydrogenase [Mariprofundales bacterium]